MVLYKAYHFPIVNPLYPIVTTNVTPNTFEQI